MEEEDPGKEIEGIYIEVGRWTWKDGIVIHKGRIFQDGGHFPLCWSSES